MFALYSITLAHFSHQPGLEFPTLELWKCLQLIQLSEIVLKNLKQILMQTFPF